MVVLLDELQEIASGRYGDADVITRQIRAVLRCSPAVATLFTGSVAHVMRDLSRPAIEPSQFGSAFELTPIADEDWGEGLRARLHLDGCAIDDDALSTLLGTTEGHRARRCSWLSTPMRWPWRRCRAALTEQLSWSPPTVR